MSLSTSNKNYHKKIFDKIQKGIDQGFYKIIRFQKKDTDGKDHIVIGFNRPGKEGKESKQSIQERFDFIVQKIPDLEPGKYQILVCASPSPHGLKEIFDINLYEKVKHKGGIIVNHENKIEEGEPETETEIMDHIELKDHIKLIHENARLQSMVDVLIHERDHYKKLYMKFASGPALKDGTEEKSWGKALSEMFNDNLPDILGLGNKLLDQRDKSLTLRELELKARNGKTTPLKNGKRMAKESIEKRMARLYEQNEEEFKEEMEDLHNSDPDKHDAICEMLEIEIEYPEEEEEQEEEEEPIGEGEEEEEEEGEEEEEA